MQIGANVLRLFQAIRGVEKFTVYVPIDFFLF